MTQVCDTPALAFNCMCRCLQSRKETKRVLGGAFCWNEKAQLPNMPHADLSLYELGFFVTPTLELSCFFGVRMLWIPGHTAEFELYGKFIKTDICSHEEKILRPFLAGYKLQ